MIPRQHRKLDAKMNNIEFQPEYNGNSPVSYEEYYGIGKERFSNKFVDFTTKTAVNEDLVVATETSMESELIDTTTVKSKGLLARTKSLFSKP